MNDSQELSRSDIVTMRWCEMRWPDSAFDPDYRRFEICEHIRIVCYFRDTVWRGPDLWVGNRVIQNPIVGDIEDLVRVLRLFDSRAWELRILHD